jgi:outer membrane lipoprotein-sorting protein
MKVFIPIIVFFMVLSGCSVNKTNSNNASDLSLDLKSVVKEIKKSENKFKNVRNRAKIEFDNGKTIQSIVLNLRVAENEALWISASMIVPIAKALITKDQLVFYEKFQRTYIDTSLKNNKGLLPPISIELIQNILFGKPVVDVDSRNWKIIQNPMQYVLTPSNNQENIQPTMFFNPKDFVLEEQRIYFSSINALLVVEYNNFKSLNEKNIPTEVFMSIIQNGKISKITIEYSQIDFPQNLTFPIEIPEGYKKININELLQ